MQRDDHPSDIRLSRRTLLAGAAAGTLAVAPGTASAQRCPAPPRQKGPLVWLDLDQQELDDAYDQSVYAFNQGTIGERRQANCAAALAVLGPPQRVAYGPTEIEKLDIYRTNRANAPINVFIHGGAWRNGHAADSAFLAEPFVKLADIGLHGNGHMMMMEKNSDAIAQVIVEWLDKQVAMAAQ